MSSDRELHTARAQSGGVLYLRPCGAGCECVDDRRVASGDALRALLVGAFYRGGRSAKPSE